MRYIHEEVDDICSYVSGSGLKVFACGYDGLSAPQERPQNVIAELLRRSETLWGTRLDYYLSISRKSDPPRLSLHQAVGEVESSHVYDWFLLAAYQDGGAISISGVMFPFQQQAPNADWWQP